MISRHAMGVTEVTEFCNGGCYWELWNGLLMKGWSCERMIDGLGANDKS